MEKWKTIGICLIGLGLLGLATAVVFFTIEIRNWRQQLPLMLTQTEKTAEKITPAVSGVSDVARFIPPIIEEVTKSREVIQALLREVKATRESIPGLVKAVDPIIREVEKTRNGLPKMVNPILEEAGKTRETIPGILKELRETRETMQAALVEIRETRDRVPDVIRNVEAIRRDLPTWLETMDRASEAVSKASAEMEKMRPMIPEVLEEVRKTREAMPAMLDKAERVVGGAKKMGAEAGKGAVGGVVSGIFTAPFSIVRSLGKKAKSGIGLEEEETLTQKDVAIIEEKILRIVKSEKTNESLRWENPESQKSGQITLIGRFQEREQDCRRLRLEIWMKEKKIRDMKLTGCRQPDGSWIETDRLE